MRAKQYIIPSTSSSKKNSTVSTANSSPPKPDYPLPPNTEKTEILRVVVRETLTIDMIDRLVTDIVNVTETLMNSDTMDLATWQPVRSSAEKEFRKKQKGEAKNSMHKGVHRSVC